MQCIADEESEISFWNLIIMRLQEKIDCTIFGIAEELFKRKPDCTEIDTIRSSNVERKIKPYERSFYGRNTRTNHKINM